MIDYSKGTVMKLGELAPVIITVFMYISLLPSKLTVIKKKLWHMSQG